MKWHAIHGIFVAGIIIGAIVLLICGLLVVRPYQISKDFHPTNCRIKEIVDAGLNECTYCYDTTTIRYDNKGKPREERKSECRQSHYPCKKVLVGYKNTESGQNDIGTLYESEGTVGDECSFVPKCERNPAIADGKVTMFVQKYEKTYLKSNSTFSCFFNPDKSSQLIQEKKFTNHSKADPRLTQDIAYIYEILHCNNFIILSKATAYETTSGCSGGFHRCRQYPGGADAFHSMLWPGIVVGVCILALVISFVIIPIYQECSRHKYKAADQEAKVEA